MSARADAIEATAREIERQAERERRERAAVARAAARAAEHEAEDRAMARARARAIYRARPDRRDDVALAYDLDALHADRGRAAEADRPDRRGVASVDAGRGDAVPVTADVGPNWAAAIPAALLRPR